MNNKGFTLVELLAMLVVLAILMAVTVPNISGILGNQRVTAFQEDAHNLVEAAKLKIAKSTTISKPTEGECLVFTLKYLDDNDSFEKGPNGGFYEKYDSFVIATREVSVSSGNYVYKYYIRLVEKKDDKYSGISIMDSDNLSEFTSDNIESIASLYEINPTNGRAKIISMFPATGTQKPQCTSAKVQFFAE